MAAIENLISAGAKGFAIVPSDSKAIVPTIKKARDAGLMVIVLDTPLDPMDAATATFATDNRKAGHADRPVGAKARSATRRRTPRSSSSISPPTSRRSTICATRASCRASASTCKDPNHYGDENDPRICDHEISQGDQEKGRTAMENALQKCPDVNVVYTINEPAAAGAWEALKGAGKDDGSVLIVSIDGGCPGVKNVEAGVIGATSQQYPHKMASMALEAIVIGQDTAEHRPKAWASSTPARQLITAKPVDGVPSISVDEGLKLCWG